MDFKCRLDLWMEEQSVVMPQRNIERIDQSYIAITCNMGNNNRRAFYMDCSSCISLLS